jgi:hypothetical protein
MQNLEGMVVAIIHPQIQNLRRERGHGEARKRKNIVPNHHIPMRMWWMEKEEPNIGQSTDTTRNTW